MTDDDAMELLRSALHNVAPEADLDDVGEDETMQEALDLDSIDFLNLVTELHQRTGLEIPERDYPQMATVAGCVAYITAAIRS